MADRPRLVVLEPHPVQYHAPVYRALVRDHDVDVIVLHQDTAGATRYHDAEFGLPIAWTGDLLEGYHHQVIGRAGPIGIARAIRALQPTVVLLTGYWPGPYARLTAGALLSGAPLLLRAETTDHARSRRQLRDWGRDTALRLLYRRCRVLLPVGTRSRAHFERLTAGAALVDVPYCVDLSGMRPGEGDRAELRDAARAELKVDEGRLVILIVGKLVARKQPALIVEAVAPLDHRDITLVYLGDGGQAPATAKLAQRVGVDARFVGFHNQHELSRWYHAADLVVLASRDHETWGLVVNEALGHGVPVVVTPAVGCAPDLVEPCRTGTVATGDGPAALRRAIEDAIALVGDPGVRQRCRDLVAGYSVERATAGIATALNRAAKGG